MIERAFSAPPGGVMTIDEGALTGELVCRITVTAAQADVAVAYAETDDFHRVEGAPVSVPTEFVDRPDAAATWLVARLSSDPGLDAADNPRPATLT